MKNRRSFIKKAAAGMLAAGLIPLSKKSMAGEVKIKGALIHHVFFWLKEPENVRQAAREAVEEGAPPFEDLCLLSRVGGEDVPAGAVVGPHPGDGTRRGALAAVVAGPGPRAGGDRL